MTDAIIPVTSLDSSTLPGVQMSVPPVEYLASISTAIDSFMSATLPSGQTGGILAVVTWKGEAVNVNLAVVQKFGDHNAIMGWIGKNGSWGAPLEGGIAWKTTW